MEFQCRTCLAVCNSEASFSLDETVLGRTLKGVIFPFLQDNNMVLSFLVRDIICSNCYQILKSFVKFIERCIEVENTLKNINNEIIECNGIAINVAPNVNCAPKQNNTVFTNNGTKLENVEKRQNKPKAVVEDLLELQDHRYFSSKKLPRTYSAKSNKPVSVTTQVEEVVPDEKPNGISNDTECSEQKQNNSVTESVEIDSDISDTIDRVYREWTQSRDETESADSDSNIYWTADGETYQMKTIGIRTPYQLPVLDSLDHYEIKDHDRTITAAQPGDDFSELLNDFADNGVEVVQVDLPAIVPNSTRKKRLLLFGSIVIRCPQCHIELDSRDELNIHYESMHAEDPPLRQPEKEMYDVFVTKKRKRIVNFCPVCNKNFLMQSSLTQHLQSAHKDYMPYKCQRCGKKFRMKTSYTKHLEMYRNLEDCNYRKCRICKQMIHQDNFVDHMKIHRNIICDECGKKFATIAHLTSHKKKHDHHPEKHLCPVCGKLFNIAGNLKHHMLTHEATSEKTYMCDKCAKVYATPYRLHWHVKKVHGQRIQHECPECHKLCSTTSALRSHKKLKHSNDCSHTCPVCGKKFVRGDYYRRHMKSHQNGGSGGARGPGTAKRYLRSKFFSPRCKYCSKLCKNLYALRQHLITHVKTIRYKCRSCSMTFANVTNRYRHEKRHKDPNFELSCKVCWKRMETKEELEEHHAKHIMNRKYKCGECGELLSSKYYFRHHMSEKHITKEDVEKEKSTVLQNALQEFLLPN